MLSSDASHLDYRSLLRASKRLDASSCPRALRLAILSDAAVPQLVPLLQVLFARDAVRAEIYLAEYDSTEIEVFNPKSRLFEFDPEVVLLLPSVNALRQRYAREVEDRIHFADRVAAEIGELHDLLASRCPAVILQSNFAPPYERPFGNFDQKVPEAFTSQAARLNLEIADQARRRSRVLVNDVAALATREGLRHWLDERLWTLAKTFCALEHLPLVAQNVVDIVLSQSGRGVKCVVTDLDGTLWSGVIGDDGIEGIELDRFGHGEPHHRLQQFLLELKRRGLILAVCSKNEHETALRAFREHPDMVLREADIAIFSVNWQPKPDNIRQIAETLNIGLDSILFLDDNPFERELVRETLPDVIVPELPEDAADYVRFLCELNPFETSSFSQEDRRRSDLYRQNASRVEARSGFTDLSAYLESLDMQIAMRPFDAFAIPRVAQLLQRSNQFNLTTRRHGMAECEAIMRGQGSLLGFYLQLADKFGDNGLISVIILRTAEQALEVDTWLMSCRVLGRGVEQYAMNRVVALAKERGYARVDGTYIPTPKNLMVRDFFKQFGFDRVGETADGRTEWRLAVSTYLPGTVPLKEMA